MTDRSSKESRHSPAWAALLSCALGACGLAMPASAAQARDGVKVRVPADLANRLAGNGAEVVAAYGVFSVLRVDRAEAQRLLGAGLAESAAQDAVFLNVGAIDTASPDARPLRAAVVPFEGRRLHLVQFGASVKPEWFEELQATGVRVVQYIPENAYLVYGDAAAVARTQAMARLSSAVQWDGAYLDRYKVQPAVDAATRAKLGLPADRDRLLVQLVRDESVNAATLALLGQRGFGPLVSRWESLEYVNVVADLPLDVVGALAARPDVVSIDRFVEPQKNDERQDRIVTGQLAAGAPTAGDYLAYLAGKGFTQAQFSASNFVVDVTDSGIDNATTTPNHFGLRVGGSLANPGRVRYNRLVGTPHAGSTLQGCDGHGNLNAHIIAGYVPDASSLPTPSIHADPSGYRYGLGVAPFVKVGSSVIFDPAAYTNPNLPNLQSSAYHDDARVSSNSWGASVFGAYDATAQTIDALVRDAQPAGSTFAAAGNQEMVILFSAGNDGPDANTTGSPGTAKNVITVGAAEGVQGFGGADQCAIADAGADSANDMISFSSRGPTDDGRVKPDIVAPGTHISGGVFQSAPVNTGSGAAAACFDATGVCAGPAGSSFFPVGQQFYTASSGTSHSTPAVAGGAALIRQHFINNGLNPPSGAMTKAVLVSSARYMNGGGANDTLPSNAQGMGMMNLDTYFSQMAGARILRDQVAADTFTASGQQRTFAGTVANAGQPFRVTLAWTDAPGPTAGNAYVNNLDLEVTVGGAVYKGNVFAGGVSASGGLADVRNNVESVFLPAGASGPFAVRVIATNIAGDGVPNVGGPLDQDFALVVANANEAAQPVMMAGAATLTADYCSASNGVLDPGETASVSFCLQNAGTAGTLDAVGTLQDAGGVTNPSAAQTYGALAAGGPPVCRPFTFTTSALACGATVSPTLHVQDGPADLGTLSWSFPTGLPVAAFAQGFDGVTVPSLPAGWTTTSEAGADAWRTVNTIPDSPPNAAFIDDPAAVSLTSLVSPTIAIPVGPTAVLSFRHNYDLEAGFDGGVLELKVGAGGFQDILAAGGSFVAGGYDRTLGACCSNPLPGRQAWSGNSAGYVTTTVNLPPGVSGQSIKLRWRRGSDATIAGTSWRVDTVSILAGRACCTTSADLGITKSDGQSTYLPGQPLRYSIVALNAGPMASSATVTDTLPPELTGASWTCAATAGSYCGSASGTGGIGTPVTLLSGGTATFTLDATASPSASSGIVNTAMVAAAAGVDDPVPANNSATDTDTRVATADLGITKTDGRTSYYPGQVLTYTITVSNAGPDASPGATVTDAVPADLGSVSWTCAASAGSSCASAAGSGSLDTRVDLVAGGNATFTVTATASPTAVGSISNTATVASATPVDPNPENNSATDVDTRGGGSYFTVPPCRVVDTREPAGPLGGPALTAGETRTFPLAGRCGIPANANAVSLNLTVTAPTAPGFLQIFPTGGGTSLVSAINYAPGQTRANNGVYALGSGGQIDVRSGQATGTTEAIVDVSGYFVE